MAIEIRIGDLSDSRDRNAITALLAEYAATLAAQVLAPPSEMLNGLLESGLAKVWLASDGSTPVGVAIGIRGYSTFHGRELLNIHDLAVAETHRGQGVGTALLDEVARDAAATGCCKLTLEVREDNPRAEQLYRRVGFRDPDGEPTRYLERPLSA